LWGISSKLVDSLGRDVGDGMDAEVQRAAC
jgi:hypothetical protein